MRLYELTDEYAGLVAMLEDCESEDDAAQIIQQINEVNSDIEGKAEAYAKIRLNLKAQADDYAAKAAIFRAEADRLAAKAKARDNDVRRLSEHLLFAMGIAGLKQIETSIGKFYTQNTLSVEVTDPWAVPEEYAIPQPPKIDKNAIKRAYKHTGEIFDGVEIVITEGVRFR